MLISWDIAQSREYAVFQNVCQIKYLTSIHHHGQRPILIICRLSDHPYFSLVTTFRLPKIGHFTVLSAVQQYKLQAIFCRFVVLLLKYVLILKKVCLKLHVSLSAPVLPLPFPLPWDVLLSTTGQNYSFCPVWSIKK